MLVRLGLEISVGLKTWRRSCSDQGPSQEVGNLGATNRMAIEEHQAGELGVQRLNYLYIGLETTMAYDTGNRSLV